MFNLIFQTQKVIFFMLNVYAEYYYFNTILS